MKGPHRNVFQLIACENIMFIAMLSTPLVDGDGASCILNTLSRKASLWINALKTHLPGTGDGSSAKKSSAGNQPPVSTERRTHSAFTYNGTGVPSLPLQLCAMESIARTMLKYTRDCMVYYLARTILIPLVIAMRIFSVRRGSLVVTRSCEAPHRGAVLF